MSPDDKRAPDARVQAGQAARQLAVFDELVIGGDQPVEDDRLGPLFEAREALG
jgi:hypothetical protein